ncbi:MAG: hypothetical protein GX346_04625 [Clostridiales bacterium]|nr:hypothetical protein [Clostridiales bacterium]
MGNKKANSFYITLGGLLSALSVVIMLMTFIPAGMYIFPAIAGMFMWIVRDYSSIKWGLICYAATSLVSLILVPDIEAKFMFIFFFGYFPIIRQLISEKVGKVLAFFLKLILFNISAIIAYYIIFNFFQIDYLVKQMDELGKYSYLIFLGIGNIGYFAYDFALGELLYAYTKWIKPKIIR